MLSALMGNRVEILRRGQVGRDALNNPIIGVVKRTRSAARLEQTGSREDDTDAYVVDQWRGYFPAGTDLRAGDEVVEGSKRFNVEGTPSAQVVSGFPGADHVYAVLRYIGEIA